MNITHRNVRAELSGGTRAEAFVAIPEAGSGPGLLVLHDRHGLDAHARELAVLYAEEGWVVLAPDLFARAGTALTFGHDAAGRAAADRQAAGFDEASAAADAREWLAVLRELSETDGDCGALGHDLGGAVAARLARDPAGPACAVAYDPVGPERLVGNGGRVRIPTVVHVAAQDPALGEGTLEALRAASAAQPLLNACVYEGVEPGFDNPRLQAFDRPAQLMAKSRTLACLRDTLGPVYDLAALWEAHLYSEFAERDVDVSMATMVDDPYVFVVPTVTGGTGKPDLHRWYSNHFHFQNPEDTRIVPISRTVGTDRLVDEFIFCFTHDRVMDWILPGVAPTGKTIEIPMMAVVNFRGAKLYHEHISWDQASVLVQAGLLDPDGLPVTGADQAAAMQDETLPRNRLIPDWR